MLVDADPLGGGIDLVLGGEDVPGVRWPDLAGARGRVPPADLAAALPEVDALHVLSWDRSDVLDVGADAMESVLRAAAQVADLVVVDLPRRPDESARVALRQARAAFLVVPAEVRAVTAAGRVATLVRPLTASLRVVVRGPAPSGLDAQVVADALGLPLAGQCRAEPGLAARAGAGSAAGRPARTARLARDSPRAGRARRYDGRAVTVVDAGPGRAGQGAARRRRRGRRPPRPDRRPRPVVAAALRAERRVLGDRSLREELAAVGSELGGLGPLQPLADDPAVTDILVTAPDEVWVERDGRLVATGVRLPDETAVRVLAQRLAAAGRGAPGRRRALRRRATARGRTAACGPVPDEPARHVPVTARRVAGVRSTWPSCSSGARWTVRWPTCCTRWSPARSRHW